MLAATHASSSHFSDADAVIVGAVVILIALSALFAMSETAMTRMSRVKAISMVEEHKRGASSLLKLVEHPESNIPVILFTLEICTLVAATLVGVVADQVVGPLGVLIATVFEVIVIFVFAELAPKIYAVQHSERVALSMAPFLLAVVHFPPLRWATWGLIKVANSFLPGKGLKQRPLRYRRGAPRHGGHGRRRGGDRTRRTQADPFDHRLRRHGRREVMVPRPDMVTVSADATVGHAADIASSAGFSRVPVYGNGIDDIVGVVYVKDMMRAERDGKADKPVTTFMRQAQFVPESKRVAEVMREMQAGKQHLAIVVDEYGGTAGLITLEDVLEELVGEISDEYDVERPRVEHLDDGQVQVDGSLSIDEVNELIGDELPEGDWDTVGGFLYHLLGHVPEEGEAADFDGHRLVAQKVDGRRIARVLIGVSVPEGAGEAGAPAPDEAEEQP